MSESAPMALNGDGLEQALRRKLGIPETDEAADTARRLASRDVRAALIAALRRSTTTDTPTSKETPNV